MPRNSIFDNTVSTYRTGMLNEAGLKHEFAGLFCVRLLMSCRSFVGFWLPEQVHSLLYKCTVRAIGIIYLFHQNQR